MTHSITLPPGFKTWNELWNSHKLIKGEQYCSLFISINQWEKYGTNDIKARAFDEIMDLEVNEELDYNNRMISFAEEFKELTNKKL